MSKTGVQTPTLVVYFGHPSSFTHKAAVRLVKNQKFDDVLYIPCHSIKEVFDYVQVGGCYGVIPISNTIAGVVEGLEEASKNTSYRVLDQIALKIIHNLLVHPEADFRKCKKVVSHPQALKQCSAFLDKNFPKLKRVSYASTSTAARDLSIGILDRENAVIASASAGRRYKLHSVAKNIQDSEKNKTLFQLIAKK